MKTQIIRSVLTLTAVTGIILLTMTASQSLALADAISIQEQQSGGLPQLIARHHRNCDRDYREQSNYRRLYDINTVETINGKIVSIDRITPTRGRSSQGVHLLVQTEDNAIDVHLGPSWYISKQDLQFTPGTEIEITGSKIYQAGNYAIIAREVKQGNKVLVLRDSNGIPVWSGWMRRSF